MKNFIRTLIPMLLMISMLMGCDQGESIIEPTAEGTTNAPVMKNTSKTTAATTTDSSTPPTEQQIGWHPEVLWTPLSVYAEADTVNKNDPVYIGKYGVYDENSVRAEIASNRKIAFALDVLGFPAEFFEVYDSQSDALTSFMSEETFNAYQAEHGARPDLAYIEDWMEEQGFEIIREHMRSNTRTINEDKVSKYPLVILFFATEEQLVTLQNPFPETVFRVYGASVEDFAPQNSGQLIK